MTEVSRWVKLSGVAVATALIVGLTVLMAIMVISFVDDDPVQDSDSSSAEVTLPADERVGSVEFEAEEGSRMVVSLDVDAMLDASTAELRGAYTVVGVTCTGLEDSSSSDSMSGTQNLLYQEATTLRTQFVYTAQSEGAQRCNASFRVPNWDPDFGDATADVDSRLTVTEAQDGVIEEAVPTSQSPIVPDAEGAVTSIDETVEIDQELEWLEFVSTAHLTTCTIENGSRDQTDENLCTPDMLDERGSTVDVTSSVEVLDDGEVCRRFEVKDISAHISHQVHHKLLGASPVRIQLPDGLCGSSIRMVQTIDNEGPAPVVVHRGSSNIVVSGG